MLDNYDLQIWVKGHSKVIENCTIGKPGYGLLFAFNIATVAVSLAVCETFSVKEWCELEYLVRVCSFDVAFDVSVRAGGGVPVGLLPYHLVWN